MIPALSSLHLQSLGLPERAATCSVQLNKNVKHYVRTSAGRRRTREDIFSTKLVISKLDSTKALGRTMHWLIPDQHR
eukprot:5852185-Ditylum_brightwellii.AAC.1